MKLETGLTAAGKALPRPPIYVDKLLCLLDRSEKILSRVEQSPADSIWNALSLLKDTLIAENFLKHPDVDVKVRVASCLSEIIRITIPVAPYDDDKMKEVFQFIVLAFEEFSDTTSRTYSKRVNILETMTKVRYCIIMLDLECDQMIIELFHHFLRAVRGQHSESIYEFMATVMVIILEESEEMTSTLFGPITDAIKRNDKDTPQNAKKFVEQVIQNCAEKLGPYLAQALQTQNPVMVVVKDGSVRDMYQSWGVKELEYTQINQMGWIPRVERLTMLSAEELIGRYNGRKAVKEGCRASWMQGQRIEGMG